MRPSTGKCALTFINKLTALGLMAVLVASCEPPLYEPHRPKSLADAASYHVAVIAAIPYESIKAKLNPGFTLKGDKALEAVIPTTATLEDKLVQAFSAAIGIGTGAPTPTKPSSPASTSATAAPANTQTVTVNTGPPPTTDPKAPKATDSKPSGRDPILEYNLATALMQEVALLNTYLDNVEKRTGLTPYILRLNVSLLPHARNQPYDAYVDLAFFNNPDGSNKESRPPLVVPLLVTDDIEGASVNRSVQMITQLALAVSAVIQAVPVAGNFNFSRDHLKSIVGTDLNSILTVSRSLDNVVRIRLGAPRQPTAGYAMIPRNNAISLLVLAPFARDEANDENRGLQIMARTSLRDAETGALLPYDKAAVYSNGRLAARRVLTGTFGDKHPVLSNDAALDAALVELIGYSQIGNVTAFKESLARHFPDPDKSAPPEKRKDATVYWQAMWTALSEMSGSNDFQGASVILPRADGVVSVRSRVPAALPVNAPKRIELPKPEK